MAAAPGVTGHVVLDVQAVTLDDVRAVVERVEPGTVVKCGDLVHRVGGGVRGAVGVLGAPDAVRSDAADATSDPSAADAPETLAAGASAPEDDLGF